MRIRNIANAAETTGIPEERLEAHEKGELRLTDDELYATALAMSCHPLSLLNEGEGDALWETGRVTRRDIAKVDEISDIQTPAGRHRLFGTQATMRKLYEVSSSLQCDYRDDEFINLECASGVEHLFRFGAIQRMNIREDFEHPPRPEFNPQFQLAITKGIDAIGANHPITDSVRKNRNSLLATMQRPLEKGVMEVRLNTGKVLNCRLSTEWGFDPSAELFHELINETGPTPHFLQIPLTPDYEGEYQYIRASDITCLTMPSEHLLRHVSPPADDDSPSEKYAAPEIAPA